jgi:DNA primase
MPGMIRDEDVQLVRNRSAVNEVIGEYLQLRSAGGGSFKGLCPFHEEKTPSLNVTPSRGLWYCFSCQRGGDVIKFVREIDNLSFVEAVERLAARLGLELRYEQGGHVPGREQSRRRRLIEAHRAAAEFYAEQLPGATAATDFLSARGFEIADAERFGAGYAPDDWEATTRHLRGRGFSEDELLAGGLATRGRTGLLDRFRGRLIWPIRDVAGEVIAFGARKLSADDNGPKYLNTPETPIFRKSSQLYGADLARREIARRRQAVIVEGYTDVMACHLAGVTTAVATCGTSFGEGHIAILRRLLMDDSQLHGEVIFTFDGDAAGRRAALRAFGMEERFVTQTFIAVQPDGMDPCDLRLAQGDAAVRELVAGRLPLYEFAVRSAIAEFDLDSAEGRIAGLDAAARIVARIKDRGLRKVYAGKVDRWLGLMDEDLVLRRIGEQISAGPRRARAGGPDRGFRAGAPDRGSRSGAPDRGSRAGAPDQGSRAVAATAANGHPPAEESYAEAVSSVAGGAARPDHEQGAAPGHGWPAGYDPRDPVTNLERQALKLAVQRPALLGPAFDALGPEVFTAPAHRAVSDLIAGCGGVAAAGPVRDWAERLIGATPNDAARSFLTRLAVEPVEAPGAEAEPNERFAGDVLAKIEELAISRRITLLKSRLQRMNPVIEPTDYNRSFGDLVALERRRKLLIEGAAMA